MFRLIEEKFFVRTFFEHIWQDLLGSCVFLALVTASVVSANSRPSVSADLGWLDEQSQKFDDGTLGETTGAIVEDQPRSLMTGERASAGPDTDAPGSEQNRQHRDQDRDLDGARFDAPWVIEIQTLLTNLDYDPGPIDGAFGDKTRSAIVAFERQRGVFAVGLPSLSIMQALRDEITVKNSAATPTSIAVSARSADVPASAPPAAVRTTPVSSTPGQGPRIRKISKADLEMRSIKPAPVSQARNDAMITVCSGKRDPMVRENIMTMIEFLYSTVGSELIEVNKLQYERSFDRNFVFFTESGCGEGDIAASTEMGYTEYLQYQNRVLELSEINK